MSLGSGRAGGCKLPVGVERALAPGGRDEDRRLHRGPEERCTHVDVLDASETPAANLQPLEPRPVGAQRRVAVHARREVPVVRGRRPRRRSPAPRHRRPRRNRPPERSRLRSPRNGDGRSRKSSVPPGVVADEPGRTADRAAHWRCRRAPMGTAPVRFPGPRHARPGGSPCRSSRSRQSPPVDDYELWSCSGSPDVGTSHTFAVS